MHISQLDPIASYIEFTRRWITTKSYISYEDIHRKIDNDAIVWSGLGIRFLTIDNGIESGRNIIVSINEILE